MSHGTAHDGMCGCMWHVECASSQSLGMTQKQVFAGDRADFNLSCNVHCNLVVLTYASLTATLSGGLLKTSDTCTHIPHAFGSIGHLGLSQTLARVRINPAHCLGAL